jgi:hypothetical protein
MMIDIPVLGSLADIKILVSESIPFDSMILNRATFNKMNSWFQGIQRPADIIEASNSVEAMENSKQQLKSAIALMLRGARCLGDGEKYDSFIESLRLIEQQADV